LQIEVGLPRSDGIYELDASRSSNITTPAPLMEILEQALSKL
jgi:hypothetical protein